jgi:hypothetical protein
MTSLSLNDFGFYAKKRRIEEQKHNCENDKHDWSNWFCVPAGLARECKGCNKTELLNGTGKIK